MEGIHIHIIALPGERLAVGLHMYSRERGDGAAGAVVAGEVAPVVLVVDAAAGALMLMITAGPGSSTGPVEPPGWKVD